jgi:hypothetical protein
LKARHNRVIIDLIIGYPVIYGDSLQRIFGACPRWLAGERGIVAARNKSRG